MEFKQKKFSNSTVFIFGKDKLKYSIKDRGGSSTFNVEYAEIPLDQNEFDERNSWYRNVGIFWVAIGFMQLYFMVTEDAGFKVPIWLLLGSVCFVFYYIARTSYTVIPTNSGSVFVIKDKKHDEILSELYQRRKGQLLSWYGKINLANEPENEIAKYQWLFDQEVINEGEFESYKNEVLAQLGISKTIH